MADKKGFTLIEILLVLIIIGILAAFAIPSFLVSVEKTNAQTAENNVLAISAADQKSFEDNGTYCATCTTLQIINTTFGMSINDARFTYSCSPAGVCQATDTNFSPTITVTFTPGQLPRPLICTSGVTVDGKGCP